MNFSEEVKREILGGKEKTDGEKKAFVSAFLRSAGSLSLVGGKVGFEIATDNADGAKTFAEYFAVVYGLTVKISEENGRKKKRNVIRYDDDATEILDDLGVLEVDAEGVKLRFGVKWDLVGTDAEKAAFLRGAFLAGGSVTDPEKRYHLELTGSHAQASREMSALLTEMGFLPRSVRRGGATVIYFKQSEHIEDLLTTIGAPASAMDVMTAKVDKSIRNGANRAMNCDMANVNKTLDAAEEQLTAIERLRGGSAWESLPEKLRQTAQLRLAYPELSLAQLAERCDPPVTKSCMNHRMRKLLEKAREQK